jgi:hypothetical protein
MDSSLLRMLEANLLSVSVQKINTLAMTERSVLKGSVEKNRCCILKFQTDEFNHLIKAGQMLKKQMIDAESLQVAFGIMEAVSVN